MICPLLVLTSVHVPDLISALHHKLGAVQLLRPSMPPSALKQAAVVEAGLLGTLGLDCLLETTSGVEGSNLGPFLKILDLSLRYQIILLYRIYKRSLQYNIYEHYCTVLQDKTKMTHVLL